MVHIKCLWHLLGAQQMSATVEERKSRTSILLIRNPKVQPLNSQDFSSLELAQEADAHLSLLNNPPSWPDIPATYQRHKTSRHTAQHRTPFPGALHVSFLWSRFAKQPGTHHTVALRTACPTLLITRLPQVLVTEPQSLPGVLIH